MARLAERLAAAHRVAAYKARVAGMLHDLARLYSHDRLLSESAERGLPIDDYARAHPLILHAPLGAELARERYGVEDLDILSAIAKHTLAAPEMSPLDCIVYLADGLEPGRDFPERPALVELAMRDLHAAMSATIRSTFRYLRERGLNAAPQSIQAAQAYDIPLEVVTGGIT